MFDFDKKADELKIPRKERDYLVKCIFRDLYIIGVMNSQHWHQLSEKEKDDVGKRIQYFSKAVDEYKSHLTS